MLDNYPHFRAMYSEEDDNTEVLYFEDATATFSSFSEAPRQSTSKNNFVQYSNYGKKILTYFVVTSEFSML